MNLTERKYFVNNLTKVYTDISGFRIKLFEKLSFNILESGVTVLLAPKGSGKSTLLKIISGLEKPTEGSVKLDGTIHFIPSKGNSFPWMNVKENLLFGLNEKDNNKINEIISFVGLDGYESHIPHNKSRGFRFRIELGRSLIRKPKFIVIDEPFDNVDSKTKIDLIKLIRKITEKGISIILTSSNITEALFACDKLILLSAPPSSILDQIDNNLSSERDDNIFESVEFVEKKKYIESKFDYVLSGSEFLLTI
ncbi:MAG: ATP-binding cassette domain-containing protein [Melioribacteraceae bacterium]|nr:ATP-binding cassette domain-containing protein [Melioribacteraceae bacterium]MDD3557872.1 ATP-binding cassette domain-containing protein [Melioribacteraceae bacterium]